MVHMREKGFGIMTVILIAIIFFLIRGTVMSMSDNDHMRNNHCYAALEKEYLQKARQLLDEEGLKNCGINLRWVDDGNGNREYTMLLHHRGLNHMSEEEIENLTDRLSGTEFHDDVCSFYYVIELS